MKVVFIEGLLQYEKYLMYNVEDTTLRCWLFFPGIPYIDIKTSKNILFLKLI